MDVFKNIGILGYFSRYGIGYGLKRGVFMANPFHIVKDYENKKILYYKKVYRQLQKKYLKTAWNDPDGLSFSANKYDNPVWVYWKQGVGNAPELVKRCIQSVIDHSQQKVIILTSDNTDQYVIFPDYVKKKLEKGNMSAAAFSDLLRFSLLEHYGGTWIDATVFLTDKLPDYVVNSDFFAYQDCFGLIENPALISNWIIHSSPQNPILRETRNMAFEYWKQESYVMDYLFTYMLLRIAVIKNADSCGWFPYANSDYCHQLLNALGEPFDDVKYRHIVELSSVHKLTYKLNDEIYRKKDTFYQFVMDGNMK